MIVNTRDFGELDVAEKDIVKFNSPILGFEDYTDFVVLIDETIGNKFAWLQSLDEKDVCFVLANPELLGDSYAPEFSADAFRDIDGKYDEMWLVAVIMEDMKKSKVNLKSPVLINTEKGLGAQIISESNLPVRFELFAGKESD